MSKKKKNKNAFKKEGQELQDFITMFRGKHGVIPSKKEYKRSDFKKKVLDD